MINMVQNAKEQAAALAMAAYQAAVADGTLPQAEVKTAPVEIPKETANGDFTTTFALAASKALRKSPRDIAQALLGHKKGDKVDVQVPSGMIPFEILDIAVADM